MLEVFLTPIVNCLFPKWINPDNFFLLAPTNLLDLEEVRPHSQFALLQSERDTQK